MAEIITDPYTTKPIEPIDPKWDPNCPGCLSGIGPDPWFCPGCLSGIGPDPDDPIKYEEADVARARASTLRAGLLPPGASHVEPGTIHPEVIVAMTLSELSPATGAERLAALPRLGVGVLYNPSLRNFIDDHAGDLDYLAIIPDRAWSDEGVDAPVRYEESAAQVALFDRAAERLRIVGHSVGLSIGSADPLDTGHVEQLAKWQARYDMPWHSEHLSFIRLPGVDAHTELSAAMALAVPYDHEVLDMLVERVGYVQERIPVPFLIENNVYYVDLPEQDMTEPEFLNALAHRTGCGMLLDVHNVVVNATNHGFDAGALIHALDLSRVVELHVAGGSELEGLYTDSHAGPVAEKVWDLLPGVVAACPNLCAITFEFHEGWYETMGAEGVLREVRMARDVWNRYH